MLSSKTFKFSCFILFILTLPLVTNADTMEHYLGIVNNIPKMEIRADVQAQMWAKSARNVLLLTCESVAESLAIANDTAKQQHTPLFCLPATVTLNGNLIQNMLPQTYQDIASTDRDKTKMTVSEVALLGLSNTYPCSKTFPPAQAIRMQSAARNDLKG